MALKDEVQELESEERRLSTERRRLLQECMVSLRDAQIRVNERSCETIEIETLGCGSTTLRLTPEEAHKMGEELCRIAERCGFTKAGVEACKAQV